MRTGSDAIRLGIALASLALAAGCGGSRGADTPEQAVTQHFERLQAGDIDGAWELYSEGMQREIETVRRAVEKWTDEQAAKQLGLEKSAVAAMSTKEFLKAAAAHRGGTVASKGPVGALRTTRRNGVLLRWTAEGELILGEDEEFPVQALVRWDLPDGIKCKVPVRSENGWKVDGLTSCQEPAPVQELEEGEEEGEDGE